MTRTIGIYARLSVTRVEGDSAVETSMGRQVQDCYRHAQQHDWKIAGVYRDEGLSGFKGVHRPEFERMLEDLRAGVIGGVLCWKLDREFDREAIQGGRSELTSHQCTFVPAERITRARADRVDHQCKSGVIAKCERGC